MNGKFTSFEANTRLLHFETMSVPGAQNQSYVAGVCVAITKNTLYGEKI